MSDIAELVPRAKALPTTSDFQKRLADLAIRCDEMAEHLSGRQSRFEAVKVELKSCVLSLTLREFG